MSTDTIYETVAKVAIDRLHARVEKVNCLDIGAGRGELLQLLSSRMAIVPHACNYHTERFALDGVSIEKVNLNTGYIALP